MSVKKQIKQIDNKEEGAKAKAAWKFLLEKEDCSYRKFVEDHDKFLGKHPGADDRKRRRRLQFIETPGRRSGWPDSWPHFVPALFLSCSHFWILGPTLFPLCSSLVPTFGFFVPLCSPLFPLCSSLVPTFGFLAPLCSHFVPFLFPLLDSWPHFVPTLFLSCSHFGFLAPLCSSLVPTFGFLAHFVPFCSHFVSLLFPLLDSWPHFVPTLFLSCSHF